MATSLWLATAGSTIFPSLSWLPLVYLGCTGLVVLTVPGNFGCTVTEILLVGLLFARLVLIPAVMQSAGSEFYTGISSLSSSDMEAGTQYLAYETIFTTAAFILLRSRLIGTRKLVSKGSDDGSWLVQPGNFVPYLLLMAVGLGAVMFPQVRERFSFFTTAIEGTAREIVSGYSPAFDGLAALANLARFAAPIAFIAWAIAAYRKSPRAGIPVLASFAIIFVNMFYISTSRASFFIPLVASVLALRVALPREKRMLTRLVGGALIVTTSVVTLRKAGGGGNGSTAAWLADYLSIYLMGPQEYAVGLRSIAAYGTLADRSTLLSDVLGNVPVLSAMAELSNRTSQFYNWSYLGSSSFEGGGFIVPASVQGAFYIGVLLGPLAATLGLALALLGERQLQEGTATAAGLYLAFFAIVTGTIYYTNAVSNLLALVSFPLIPLLVVGSLDRRLGQSLATSPRKSRRQTQTGYSS
ncbi:hypothetical protein [Janibacter terrae]|uniref:hypothetical protein n=1 Tax=Janibacter terrae TaxID=103817 RepID=UPI0031F73167